MGNEGCVSRRVEVETADRILSGRSSVVAQSPASNGHACEGTQHPAIDLMKVHVQGDELLVLRGAAGALASGCVCTLTLKLSSVGFSPESAEVVGQELQRHLAGFKIVLVAANSSFMELPQGAAGAALLAKFIAGTRQPLPIGWRVWDDRGRGVPNPWDRELVAWRRRPRWGPCHSSLAAGAAARLWR